MTLMSQLAGYLVNEIGIPAVEVGLHDARRFVHADCNNTLGQCSRFGTESLLT